MSENKELKYSVNLKDLFSKKMSGAVAQTKKLDSSMNSLKGKLASTLGGIAVGAGIVSFGKAVIDSLKNYEYFSAALRTLLKGDKNAANALQGQLVQLAKTTPFSLNEVQDATKQLLAYGFKAGDVVETMTKLGDVAAGIGQPVGEIAYLYGTLKTSGRVTLMDLRQFAGRGIPIYETLAKRLKVTTGEINKMVSAGKIGFKDVEGAFADMTSKGGQFFEMMKQQSKTVGGQISNMGDAWEQIKVNIGKSQTGIIASTLNWANNMLNAINDVLAQANRLEEAFAGTKAKGWGAMENFYNWIGRGTTNEFYNKHFTGYKGKTEMLDRSVQDMYVKPSGRSGIESLGSMKDLHKLKANYGKAFANKEIGGVEYDRAMAIFEHAQKQIEGNMKLFGYVVDKNGKIIKDATLGGKESALDKAGSAKNLGSTTDISATRPQSLVINIGKMIEKFELHSTNVTEGFAKIKDKLGEMLVEVANDANIVAKV